MRAACAGGAVIRELYVAPGLLAGRDGDVVAAAERGGAFVVELGAAAFSSLTGAQPDGLLAVVERPALGLAALELPADPFVVVAVGIERPGNLGTIARTASAAGADRLIVADPRADLFHRDTIRGSVGAVFHVGCAAAPSAHVLDWLRAREIRIVATSPAAGRRYWEASYRGAVAVVLGCERHGLPASWLDAADDCVSIPAHGHVDSLNVAVAAGVVLCEAARAR